jgi:hypothetical protein
MPFTEEVRITALTAAARHCCVCHRYKGVKIEVHHIVPESEGGPNTSDNAIALCFDCHTDAGHYNADHPRGTRFSRRELRRHRELWHTLVQRNGIEQPAHNESLHCRYLVRRQYGAIREIVEGDLSKLPIPRPLLAKTDVLAFQRTILRSSERSASVEGPRFQTKDELLLAYPHATVIASETEQEHPIFEAVWTPEACELALLSKNDFLTSELRREGVEAVDLARGGAYCDACGSDGFQVTYVTRELWSVYLAATNATGVPIIVRGIECHLEETSGLCFRPLHPRPSGPRRSIRMPPIRIRPDETVVVPIATVLGPIGRRTADVWSSRCEEFTDGLVQEFSHGDYSSLSPFVRVIGPVIRPIGFELEREGELAIQPVHELDFGNTYVLDRYWECGSCPHLFFSFSSGAKHVGELFAMRPDFVQTHSFVVPSGVRFATIAELQNETTRILEVVIDGVTTIRERELHRGDCITIQVNEAACLLIRGFYHPESPLTRKADPWRSNEMVRRYLALIASVSSV